VTLSLYSFPWLKHSCSVSLFRHDHHHSLHAGTARKHSLPSAAASRSTSVAPNVLLERMTSSCNVASFCSTRVSSASHDFAAPPGPALHEVNEITGERARASRKTMYTQIMRRRVLSSYQADMIIIPLYNRYKCYMVKRVLYDDERWSNARRCVGLEGIASLKSCAIFLVLNLPPMTQPEMTQRSHLLASKKLSLRQQEVTQAGHKELHPACFSSQQHKQLYR
jgi:hypothetical protein